MLVFSDIEANTENVWQQLGDKNLAEMLYVVYANVALTLTQMAL